MKKKKVSFEISVDGVKVSLLRRKAKVCHFHHHRHLLRLYDDDVTVCRCVFVFFSLMPINHAEEGLAAR